MSLTGSLAGLMQVTEPTIALIYLIQASVCVMNQNLLLATGNWKHVSEGAFPPH